MEYQSKMIIQLNKMKNCPVEMKEDINEIFFLSRKFLSYIDIYPNQDFEEIKVDLQEGKNCLFFILARFLTLISHNITKKDLENIKKSMIDTGMEFKFSEDIGEIIKYINENHPAKPNALLSIASLLKFAGELKTIWDFIIFHPIITANNLSKTRDEYIENIFKMVRTNASILSQTGKVSLSVSKALVPGSTSLIRGGNRTFGESQEEESEEVDIPDILTKGNEGENYV